MGRVKSAVSFRNGFEPFPSLGILLLSFSFFLWHLCPSLYWRDPGEFATIAFTLSVGHPTGSPTYSLIAKLFTFLPFASLFQKINLVSAVFGSLTVYLVFRLVFAVIRLGEPSERKWISIASAGCAALLLMVSPTFWLYSLVAKGYPQLTFWIALLCLLLFHFREEAGKSQLSSSLSARGQSLFFTAAFLFGLSLGTYGAMVLYLPALLAFCFLADRRWYREPKIVLMGIFFFLLGFSVYLYLPLRSSTTPFLDWGEPKTFLRFFNHLRDAKDAGHNYSFPLSSLATLAFNSLKVLSNQFTPFGILLGVIGAAALFKSDRGFFWLTFGIASIHWLFFVRIWGMAFLYIPLFLIFAIWIGLGVFSAVRAIQVQGETFARQGFRKALSFALWGAVAATFFLSMAGNEPLSGKRQYYVPYAVGKEMLRPLPPRAFIFSYYSSMVFHALQSVENFRPDVFVGVRSPLRAPELFWSFDQKHYPVLDFTRIPKVIRPNSTEFFATLIDTHIQQFPIYWDFSAEDRWLAPRLTPEKFLYRVQLKEKSVSGEIREVDLKETTQLIQDLSSLEGFWGDEEGRRFLKNLAGLKGVFLLNRGHFSSSLFFNRLALKLLDDDATLYTNQGILLSFMSRREEALRSWQKAIELDPLESSAWLNRAFFYQQNKQWDRAFQDWERAAALGGTGILAHYYRALAYRDLGKPREALADLQAFMNSPHAINYLGDDPVIVNARKVIQELSIEVSSGGKTS